MKKLLFFLGTVFLGHNGFAQKQITEFSPTSVTSYSPNLTYLHQIDNDLYFKDYRNIYKYSNQKLDTLMSIVGQELNPIFSDGNLIYSSRFYSTNTRSMRIISALDLKNKSWTVKDTVDDFKVLDNARVLAFTKGDYFEIDYVNRTRLQILEAIDFIDIYSRKIFKAIQPKDKSKVFGFFNEKGLFVSLDFPEIKGKNISVMKEIGNGYYLINTNFLNEFGMNISKNYVLKDNKIFPFSHSGNFENTSYYVVNNELFEVFFENRLDTDQIINKLNINKIVDGKNTEIASHSINAYLYYLKLATIMGKPGPNSYSIPLLVDNNLYFFANENLNTRNLNPLLRLYKVNLESGVLVSKDVTEIIDVEEFKRSFYAQTYRDLSMILEVKDNKLLIYSGIRKPKEANAFEIDLELKNFRKREETKYDPRDFVKIKNGLFDASIASILYENGKIEQLNFPKEKSIITKEKLIYESENFGTIIQGTDHLYILNQENGMNQLSIVNKEDEISTYDISNSFSKINILKTIDADEYEILSISGKSDTLSIFGNYLFSHEKSTGKVNYLDVYSFDDFLDLTNASISKIGDKTIIQNASFVLTTNFKSSYLISDFKILQIKPDYKFIGLKNGKFVEFDAKTDLLKELEIKASVYAYQDNSLFYVSENTLFKTDFTGISEKLFTGNITALKIISNTDLIVFQENDRYLYNIKDKKLTKLNIDLPPTHPLENNIVVNYFKVKDDLLVERYDNRVTYLKEMYLYDNKLNKIFERRFGEVFANFNKDELWIKITEYPSISFFKYENGKFTEKLKSTELTTSGFVSIKPVTYYKSVIENKIYLYEVLTNEIVEVPSLSASYKDLKTIKNDLNYHYLLATSKDDESKDLIKFSFDSLNYTIIKKDVGNFSNYYLADSEPFFIDTKNSKYSVTYKDSVIYNHNSSSKIDTYGRAFAFKDNLYIIALENGKGYQLYKFDKPKDKEIVLSKESDNFDLNFYPNPSSDFLNISSKFNLESKVQIQIISTDGRVLSQSSAHLPHRLNIQELKFGTYLIRVSDQKNAETFRFIKD